MLRRLLAELQREGHSTRVGSTGEHPRRPVPRARCRHSKDQGLSAHRAKSRQHHRAGSDATCSTSSMRVTGCRPRLQRRERWAEEGLMSPAARRREPGVGVPGKHFYQTRRLSVPVGTGEHHNEYQSLFLRTCSRLVPVSHNKSIDHRDFPRSRLLAKRLNACARRRGQLTRALSQHIVDSLC